MEKFAAFASSLLILSSVSIWIYLVLLWRTGQRLVPYEPRRQVPWSGWDVLLLICAWVLLDGVAMGVGMSLGADVEAPDAANLSVREFTLEMLAALSMAHLVWVGLAIVYLALRTRVSPREFGFDTGRLGADVRLGAGAFVAAILPVYGLQNLVTRFVTPEVHPIAKLLKEYGSWAMVLVAASAVVVAPLAEELLFRVALQGWLERLARQWRRKRLITSGWATVLPILVSSTCFALLHQGSDQVALFALALVLGTLYRQTHRIWPPLALHVCFNLLGVLGVLAGAD